MHCDYEVAQHQVIALGAGAATPEVAAVLAGELSVLPPEDRIVLELVGSTVRDGQAGEAAVIAVREMLGDQGLVELLLVTASYMGLAALLNVLDVDIDREGRLRLT